MTLAAQGLDNDELAARLYLSIATVKTHISRAMSKLRIRSRAQLVIFAYETGLVRAGWRDSGTSGNPPTQEMTRPGAGSGLRPR